MKDSSKDPLEPEFESRRKRQKAVVSDPKWGSDPFGILRDKISWNHDDIKYEFLEIRCALQRLIRLLEEE